jgi:hypothetical protein
MNHTSFFNLRQKESKKSMEQNNYSRINHKPIPMHKLPSISPLESSPKSNLFSKNSLFQKKNSSIPSKQQSETVQQKFREYYERSPVPAVISKSLSPQSHYFQVPQKYEKKNFREAKDFLRKTSTLNQSVTRPMSVEMNIFDKQYNDKVEENLKKIDSILMGKVFENSEKQKDSETKEEIVVEQEKQTDTQEIESLLGFEELEQFDSANEINSESEQTPQESPVKEINKNQIQKPLEKKSMEIEWKKYGDNPFDQGGFGDSYESEEKFDRGGGFDDSYESEEKVKKVKKNPKPNLKRKRKIVQSSEEEEDEDEEEEEFDSGYSDFEKNHFAFKKAPKVNLRTSKSKEKSKTISRVPLKPSPPMKKKVEEVESVQFRGNMRKVPRLEPKKQISHNSIPEPSKAMLIISPSKNTPQDSSVVYDIPSLNETLLNHDSDSPVELVKTRERYVDTKVKKIVISENSNDFLQLIHQKIPTSMNINKLLEANAKPKPPPKETPKATPKSAPKAKKKSISKFNLGDESMDNDSMDEDFKPN